MPLLSLVLEVGTAGMTMGVDLGGSKWNPSFMTALDIPSGVHMSVQFGPEGKISGFWRVQPLLRRLHHRRRSHQDRPARLDPERLPRADSAGNELLCHARGRQELRAGKTPRSRYSTPRATSSPSSSAPRRNNQI
jgi:hypothetical protein